MICASECHDMFDASYMLSSDVINMLFVRRCQHLNIVTMHELLQQIMSENSFFTSLD